MNLYNKDYYENGVELNISGYTNFQWMPTMTKAMCKTIIEHLDIKKKNTILDFGCAKGFIVKAFCQLGYQAYGVDISEYAYSQRDKDVYDRIFHYSDTEALKRILSTFDPFDFIISKDVFEHIPYEEIGSLLKTLSIFSHKIFAIVPLGDKGKYIIPDYENDITHIIRENREWWEQTFIDNGFELEKFDYLIPGIKDNWSEYKEGNGFFILNSKI